MVRRYVEPGRVSRIRGKRGRASGKGQGRGQRWMIKTATGMIPSFGHEKTVLAYVGKKVFTAYRLKQCMHALTVKISEARDVSNAD